LAYATWHARRAASDLRASRFRTFAEGAMPPWVEGKLRSLREQFSALGYRYLVSYTRESSRLNYTIVLLSADGSTSIHLWVASFRGLMRWLNILNGWRPFINDMRLLPRWAIISHYNEDRRYESSSVDLSQMDVPGLMEHVPMPEAVPFAEAVRLHASGAASFAARTSARPVAITTAEDFFEMERVLCRQVAGQMQRLSTGAAASPKKRSSGTGLVIFWMCLVIGFTVMWHFVSRPDRNSARPSREVGASSERGGPPGQ
jgi:hypothetical protein